MCNGSEISDAETMRGIDALKLVVILPLHVVTNSNRHRHLKLGGILPLHIVTYLERVSRLFHAHVSRVHPPFILGFNAFRY